MAHILSDTDGGLLTKENCAVVFIDHQPQMTFGVSNIDRQLLVNNVLMLAKGAKEYGVPVILTAVETESFSGYIWPELMDIFPGLQPIERSSMNSWDDEKFKAAIRTIGKQNIVIAGLWTEVCVAWPTLNLLHEGYNVYVVEDACGATSHIAHDAAIRRVVQAGAVPMTSVATVLEFQRDWANKEHYDAVLQIFRQHGGAYGDGIDYAYTMVHKAPQKTKNPHVVV
ncbi:hydrolase [Desulfopila aestuarii]|uniref:Nicotinamidase-related amidase n=1 Tax=Desulfopila aestuarii DSM 18488 TaxID=1121416 RepID=A0A1M7YLL9_9BACT|nr:hydrolase [Desulfopila aestuarii]SHO53476.1 Nicotinamidase-related amidase [Desulfopila aestuarii DSM 18488]